MSCVVFIEVLICVLIGCSVILLGGILFGLIIGGGSVEGGGIFFFGVVVLYLNMYVKSVSRINFMCLFFYCWV